MTIYDCKIDGDNITISKDVLEKWRDHYWEVSRKQDDEWRKGFYIGKADVYINILKLFEPLEA